MGGVSRSEREMQAFRDCVDDCDFKDLGFRRSMFTWTRGNHPNTHVKERLDRFLTTS